MKRLVFISSLLSLVLFFPAVGQVNDSIPLAGVQDTLYEDLSLFSSDIPLNIALYFNITEYKRNRFSDEYLDAKLIYHNSEKDSIIKDIKVRPRGVMRRSICDLPPLMLNFKMKDHVSGEFNRIDKLKMVTLCKAGDEKYLLKEYLIYKLYSVLTNYSFKVRLLHVDYFNTYKPGKHTSEFAFVLEPVEFLVERTNSVEVKSTKLAQKNMLPEAMNRLAIFNYMIGNTDWSVPLQHNVVILAMNKSAQPDLGMIIPYDFDKAGLVDADYAIPAEELGIESVRERYFLGICRSEQELKDALIEFTEKKAAFYKVIQEFPYLNDKAKKEMTSYLDEFYLMFDKRNTIISKLLINCN